MMHRMVWSTGCCMLDAPPPSLACCPPAATMLLVPQKNLFPDARVRLVRLRGPTRWTTMDLLLRRWAGRAGRPRRVGGAGGAADVTRRPAHVEAPRAR